ncbi:MAG: hypothetical protein JXA96_15040, partial [Sedimentisphaerales bacterium]|nr:hypothetical protein [Sedimentisphaerales bacterium]
DVRPSGIIPEEIENDPIVQKHSSIRVEFQYPSLKKIGTNDYLPLGDFEENSSNIYGTSLIRKEWDGLYFDKKSGLIVNHVLEGEGKDRSAIRYYTGPNGISKEPEEKLGKFESLILDRTSSGYKLVVYDKTLRRFYKIDYVSKIITTGPQLAKDDEHQPVQIGWLIKNSSVISNFKGSPCITDPNNINLEKGLFTNIQGGTFAWNDFVFYGAKYLPVLNANNRIDLLDTETLEISGKGGLLFTNNTLAESGKSHSQKPEDLLAYRVQPIYLDQGKQYLGMMVAAVNRECTNLNLLVSDANGTQINTAHSSISGYGKSVGKVIYFEVPWNSTLTIIKYVLESLQPTSLLMASYFTANSFEAGSGYRALFVLPNSFVAMKGRDVYEYFIVRLSLCFLFMFPSLFLSIVLSKLIDKNARSIGLPDKERICWVIGTVFFGLASYITYRITQPKLTLVTCQNCGKPRRLDTEKCHNCKSKWHVPELTPPSWRVFDF